MRIKPLPRTPRIPNEVDDAGAFIKALHNIFVDISATVNAMLDDLQEDDWVALTPLNSWNGYGAGYAPAGCIMDAGGFVHLRGAVKGGSGAICTLPTNYRPAFTVAAIGMSDAPCKVSIATDGSVTTTGNNTFVSLDGIIFKAAT